MQECEQCGNRFNLGINGSTTVMEDKTEHKICNYCCDEFCKTYDNGIDNDIVDYLNRDDRNITRFLSHNETVNMLRENKAEDTISKQVIFKIDGDMICATLNNFINLQESPAGFGNNKLEAFKDLIKEYKKVFNIYK